MFYKYKKYKKKYIDFKNQIGGECIISPNDDDNNDSEPISLDSYKEFKLVNSLTNFDFSIFSCYSSTEASLVLFNSVNQGGNIGFPYNSILDSITKAPVDINQIWYNIVNNNNYIHKLHTITERSVNIQNSVTQDEHKTASKFFNYSEIQKDYIESWLKLFKRYKIYIMNYSDINIRNSIAIKKITESYNKKNTTVFDSVIKSTDKFFFSTCPESNILLKMYFNEKISLEKYLRTKNRTHIIPNSIFKNMANNIIREYIKECNITHIINHIKYILHAIELIIKTYDTYENTIIFNDTNIVENIRHDINSIIINKENFKKSEKNREYNNKISTEIISQKII